MRTGDEERFNNLRYTFQDRLEVWLRDDRGEKWTDSLLLREGEYPINITRTEVFARDRGVTGSYRYTLRYRMRRLPAS